MASLAPKRDEMAEGYSAAVVESNYMKTTDIQPGDRFGKWIVLGLPYIVEGGIVSRQRGKYVNRYTQRWWYVNVRCDCGNESDVVAHNIMRGLSSCCQSCRTRRVKTRHGATKNGGADRLYTAWCNMRARCYNPKDPSYSRYGGRGIFVCPEWRASYEPFRDWAIANGYADHLTIERVDNDLPYYPENCRWADKTEQANNRGSSAPVEAWGETKTIAQWSKDPRCVVEYHTLRYRLQKAFWPAEKAITTPPCSVIPWEADPFD